MNHTSPTQQPYLTAAFYKFVALADLVERREQLLALCEAHHIQGLILLAPEGINGTVSGTIWNVRMLLSILNRDALFADLKHKEAWSDEPPFHRMKVRVKPEIVTLGMPGVDAANQAGTYVKPADWNALIQDPDLILIDTRNDYEVDVGTFAGAINPRIKKFTELPAWVASQKELLAPHTARSQRPDANTLAAVAKAPKLAKVAMFCTGGIRCEKSTAYMRSLGFDEVFHLEGGILAYLEVTPPEHSLWQGECFVFDERVAVTHGLAVGTHELCRACRLPVSPKDKTSPQFEQGVSCPRCFALKTPVQKQRAHERQRQVQLALARQQRHVGDLPNA